MQIFSSLNHPSGHQALEINNHESYTPAHRSDANTELYYKHLQEMLYEFY